MFAFFGFWGFILGIAQNGAVLMAHRQTVASGVLGGAKEAIMDASPVTNVSEIKSVCKQVSALLMPLLL